MMRLDKFISDQTGCGRKTAAELIRKGKVTVNGTAVKDPSAHITPEKDEICSAGERLTYSEHIYIMLNKPSGYVCSTDDPVSRTVLDLLPENMQRKGLFPAGRLDKDTTGFVLITDDGELAHKILSPRSHAEKEYEVRLERPLSPDTAERFAAGIDIGGEICRPARLITSDDPLSVNIIITEGKFHQIKRMFAAADNHVEGLKRIRIGGVCLDERLSEGECRLLSDEETALLSEKTSAKPTQKRRP